MIVTGTATGEIPSVNNLREVRKAVTLPVLIGSGIDVDNIAEYWNLADGFIVGSSLKVDGNWENDVDQERVAALMNRIRTL